MRERPSTHTWALTWSLRVLTCALTWAALGCVVDSDVAPRHWSCILTRGGEFSPWSASPTAAADEGAAERECEWQGGSESDCGQCVLDEEAPASAPYYCHCGGVCLGVGTVSTDWQGSALSKASAGQQCILKLAERCSASGGNLDVNHNVWAKCT